MALIITITLLILNIIGFSNRRKSWSKIFLLSQVFIFVGIFVIFNLSQNERQELEAKRKMDVRKAIDSMAVDNINPVDIDKGAKSVSY